MLDEFDKRVADKLNEIDGNRKAVEAKFNESLDRFSTELKALATSKYSDTFASIADEHKKESYIWLAISAVFAVILVVIFSLGTLDRSIDLPAIEQKLTADLKLPAGVQLDKEQLAKLNEDKLKVAQIELIQAITTKIVIVSIIFYVIILGSRNFRNNRHLFVINKHRSLALNTFKAFLDGAQEKETKEEILLGVTRCIFSNTNTGYLGKDEGFTNPILEVINNIKGKGE